MTTTYDRISYTLLRVSRRRSSWPSKEEIVNAIRVERPPEMKVRGDGSADEHYMSKSSIEQLLTLMSELKLIESTPAGRISANQTAVDAVRDRPTFSFLVQARVETMLEDQVAPLQKIDDIIGTIMLPEVPTAKIIYNRLEPKIGLDKFRKLLYLYSCAGGIDRYVRVYYGALS